MIETILNEIDGEIARLQQARILLMGLDEPNLKRGPGRPPLKNFERAAIDLPRKKMSPEAREKIRQSQIKRWAATRKTTSAK